MTLNFIVVAPPHSTRSGGVMVLHDLCTALNKLNYKSGIIFIAGGGQDNQDYTFGYSAEKSLFDPDGEYYDFITGRSSDEIDDFVKNAFIIYPDIVFGNPIGSKYYATYVLGIPKRAIESKFIITYFNFFVEKSNYTLCKPFLSSFMNEQGTSHWSQRSLSLTYIGKGSEKKENFPVPGSILIQRNWPSDKRQLGILLKNCKYFFTWDNLSATNYDAVICGALPVLMDDNYLPNDLVNKSEFGKFPQINYNESMDLRSTPSNITEIDSVLIDMKIKIHRYNDTWLLQVGGLVTQLTIFFDL
jgi:hypothetical protein